MMCVTRTYSPDPLQEPFGNHVEPVRRKVSLLVVRLVVVLRMRRLFPDDREVCDDNLVGTVMVHFQKGGQRLQMIPARNRLIK